MSPSSRPVLKLRAEPARSVAVIARMGVEGGNIADNLGHGSEIRCVELNEMLSQG